VAGPFWGPVVMHRIIKRMMRQTVKTSSSAYYLAWPDKPKTLDALDPRLRERREPEVVCAFLPVAL